MSHPCPCLSWLEAYELLGNEHFNIEEHSRHYVCLPCKIHTAGHGAWCNFCSGREVVNSSIHDLVNRYLELRDSPL